MQENITSYPERKKGLRIVFMGTPEFAVASLDKLLYSGCNIVGVVTAPDKPAGRGMQPGESAVKKYARANNLPVLQPEKLKDAGFLEDLRSLHADLQVVVAFRMLPEVVWNMPLLGTINLHASLLPQYRGAAPINWAIINGEKETGVTTFKLQHEIDTGNILLSERISIGDEETAGELLERMKDTGADILLKTIDGISSGTITETVQAQISSTGLKHAPKIFSDTGRIDWSKSADEIHNLIRGLSPYPTAFTYLGDKMMKIFNAVKEPSIPASKAGEYETDKRSYLKFACADGYINVKELQLQGKKRMPVEEFLRGYRF